MRLHFGYVGMGNNPVSEVDPTGGETSPIVDENGNFLGYDSQGEEGDLIYMYKKDFVEGMDHNLAMEKAISFQKTIYVGRKESWLSSGFVNLRAGYSFQSKSVSMGPSLELSTKSIAGSFNLTGNSNTWNSFGPGLSLEIGGKFKSGGSDFIYSDFKVTGGISEISGFSILGNGLYVRSTLDPNSGDRSYMLGIKLGVKAEVGIYTNEMQFSVGVKGTESEQLRNFNSSRFSFNR